MNNHRYFLEDDDNDTALFERLQQMVLRNYPNSERVGCPSPSTLKAFVEDPASITPAELNDLHILKCAECTRDLMELREKRESAELSKSRPHHGKLRGLIRPASVLAASCGMLLAAIALWRDESPAPNPTPSAPSPAARTIDLSSYAARGSTGQPQPNRIFFLPRATIDLDLFLPYLTRPGRYHVTVRREHRADAPLTSMDGIADAVGTRTKLRIRLNLRDLPNGRYYLCIVEQGKNASSFYPFELN